MKRYVTTTLSAIIFLGGAVGPIAQASELSVNNSESIVEVTNLNNTRYNNIQHEGIDEGIRLAEELSKSDILTLNENGFIDFDYEQAIIHGVDKEVANELSKVVNSSNLRGKCGFKFKFGPQARTYSRIALIAAAEAYCSGGLAALGAISWPAMVAVSAAIAVTVGAAVGAPSVNVMVTVPGVSWTKTISLP